MRPPVIGLAGLARSGKDSVADTMAQIMGADRYAFAEPLKTMLTSVFGPHFHIGDRERLCPEAGVSYRHLMQTLGTEWGRDQVGKDLWVNLVERRYNAQKASADQASARNGRTSRYTMILSDVRFASEAQWVKLQGGLVIYVERSGLTKLDGSGHASEADEARLFADVTVFNDGSLADLHRKAHDLAWFLMMKQP